MRDGVLIYFGYPQAHEDDAGRAVRAGLEVVAAVAAIKDPSARPDPRRHRNHRHRTMPNRACHIAPSGGDGICCVQVAANRSISDGVAPTLTVGERVARPLGDDEAAQSGDGVSESSCALVG